MAWIENEFGQAVNLRNAQSMRTLYSELTNSVKVVADICDGRGIVTTETVAFVKYEKDDAGVYYIHIDDSSAVGPRTLDDITATAKRVMLNIAGLADSALVIEQSQIRAIIASEA